MGSGNLASLPLLSVFINSASRRSMGSNVGVPLDGKSFPRSVWSILLSDGSLKSSMFSNTVGIIGSECLTGALLLLRGDFIRCVTTSSVQLGISRLCVSSSWRQIEGSGSIGLGGSECVVGTVRESIRLEGSNKVAQCVTGSIVLIDSECLIMSKLLRACVTVLAVRSTLCACAPLGGGSRLMRLANLFGVIVTCGVPGGWSLGFGLFASEPGVLVLLAVDAE